LHFTMCCTPLFCDSSPPHSGLKHRRKGMHEGVMFVLFYAFIINMLHVLIPTPFFNPPIPISPQRCTERYLDTYALPNFFYFYYF
jgi:hypothetical protein